MGTITISPPRFTPILPTDKSEGIDFGSRKSVESLWTAVTSGNFSVSSVEVEQTAVSASLAVAGPSIDSTRTRETSGGALTADTSKSTVTQKTPDIPTPTTAPTLGDAKEKLVALLAAGAFKPTLTPDQIATLVASYRSYMQAIEQFSNFGDLLPEDQDDPNAWLPYRASFVVTADPGWYTIKEDYEAVLDVSFGDASAQDYQLVSVMPGETAQVIEDFQASLRSLALALGLSGAYGPVAGAADLNRLEALAERLQGQRTNTNLIVSYPDQRTARIRIRPQMSAERKNSRDLQPTSKLMTAVLLVKNRVRSTGQRTAGAAVKTSTSLIGKRFAEQTNLVGTRPSDATKDATRPARQQRDPEKIWVSVAPHFAPAPNDRRFGGGLENPNNSVYYPIPRDQLSGVAATKPTGTSSICSFYELNLPDYELPAAPPIAIVALSGSYTPPTTDDKGQVAILYRLKMPTKPKSLSAAIAGAVNQPPGGFPVPVSDVGVLTVDVRPPAVGRKALELPVQFTATFEQEQKALDENGEPIRVTLPDGANANLMKKIDVTQAAVQMLSVPLVDPVTPTTVPTINIKTAQADGQNLPINADSIELIRAILGLQADVRLNAPPPPPQQQR